MKSSLGDFVPPLISDHSSSDEEHHGAPRRNEQEEAVPDGHDNGVAAAPEEAPQRENGQAPAVDRQGDDVPAGAAGNGQVVAGSNQSEANNAGNDGDGTVGEERSAKRQRTISLCALTHPSWKAQDSQIEHDSPLERC